MLSGRKFVLACAIVACALAVIGRMRPLPVSLVAAEVFITILSLFVFGSFKYQIHKNALTYGMVLVIVATFLGLESTAWHRQVAADGLWPWLREHVLSFHGLDELIHADTMLFILGLTFFVAVIAQTRILEGVTFFLLRRNSGEILPTVIAVTAVVAFSSGILDGVSMIGLTIRTLVIILMLAAAPKRAVLRAVMICTTVTTVCGVWLAYGEPPNLIMKANLDPSLGGTFFIRYCGPIALVAYFVVARHLRKELAGQRIDLDRMDVLDANAEDVRFLQASRHGEVLTPVELVEAHARDLEGKAPQIVERVQQGTSLGRALVDADLPWETRELLLGHYVSEELATSLDRHYVLDSMGDDEGAMRAEQWVDDTLAASAQARRRAQRYGALALIPFVGLLVVHGVNHEVPLFLASFAGFGAAMIGIAKIPKMRDLALNEGRHEYAEYYFLFPLFLSITLLTQAGFFDDMAAVIRHGVDTFGHGAVAWAQFSGATVALRDTRQQHRGGLRVARARDLRPPGAPPVRDGADRGIRARRLLDAHRIGAVGRRVLVHSARRGRRLHADPVDQGNDPGDSRDVRAHYDRDRDRELASLEFGEHRHVDAGYDIGGGEIAADHLRSVAPAEGDLSSLAARPQERPPQDFHLALVDRRGDIEDRCPQQFAARVTGELGRRGIGPDVAAGVVRKHHGKGMHAYRLFEALDGFNLRRGARQAGPRFLREGVHHLLERGSVEHQARNYRASANVSQARGSPVCIPRRNHDTRWADEPCVNDSGTTRPRPCC